MTTLEELNALIEKAAEVVGSQAKLAEVLELHKSNLTHMKQGTRKANWKIRGKLRAITGEDPAHAFMAAMAEDLEETGGEDEKKAAEGFKTLMAAFPDDWRRLLLSPHKTLRAVARFCLLINQTFHYRIRNTKALPNTLECV